ncbi:MAG: DUF4440 domain-containing protein [Gemmatimonadetes bacterium]|nr:DUF4440 domain-containing protein [Gemmatimonadota bacterium]
MRSRAVAGILFALPLALAACGGGEPEAEAAPAPVSMTQAGADAMRNAFVYSFMSKDTIGASAFYAENAVMYGADGKVMNGKAAIRTGLADMMRAGVDSIGLTSQSFTAAGNDAVDEGTYVMRQLDRNKEATRTTGGYRTTISRQADGSFQVVKDSTWQTGVIEEPK